MKRTMKNRFLVVLIALLTVFSLTSYAGTWYGSDAAGWTYRDDAGNAVKGSWVLDNGAWYYLGADGIMLHDQWIDGKYYVGSNGAMLHDTVTPDGYRVGSDGAWIPDAGPAAATNQASFGALTAMVQEGFLGQTQMIDDYSVITCNNVYGDEGTRTVYIIEDIISLHSFTQSELAMISDGVFAGSADAFTLLTQEMSAAYGQQVRVCMTLRYNYQNIGSRIY